jgi:hypothetical protein
VDGKLFFINLLLVRLQGQNLERTFVSGNNYIQTQPEFFLIFLYSSFTKQVDYDKYSPGMSFCRKRKPQIKGVCSTCRRSKYLGGDISLNQTFLPHACCFSP